MWGPCGESRLLQLIGLVEQISQYDLYIHINIYVDDPGTCSSRLALQLLLKCVTIVLYIQTIVSTISEKDKSKGPRIYIHRLTLTVAAFRSHQPPITPQNGKPLAKSTNSYRSHKRSFEPQKLKHDRKYIAMEVGCSLVENKLSIYIYIKKATYIKTPCNPFPCYYTGTTRLISFNRSPETLRRYRQHVGGTEACCSMAVPPTRPETSSRMRR